MNQKSLSGCNPTHLKSTSPEWTRAISGWPGGEVVMATDGKLCQWNVKANNSVMRLCVQQQTKVASMQVHCTQQETCEIVPCNFGCSFEIQQVISLKSVRLVDNRSCGKIITQQIVSTVYKSPEDYQTNSIHKYAKGG